MKLWAIAILCAFVFLVCFLVDLLLRTLFPKEKIEKSKQVVHLPRRQAIFGIILTFAAIVVFVHFLPQKMDVPLLLGGSAALLIGAGLLINDQMQVVGTNGLVIPGLYAGWHTAGGACGENSYIGDPILGSLMGDVGLAFCGGYLCGTSVIDNEF